MQKENGKEEYCPCGHFFSIFIDIKVENFDILIKQCNKSIKHKKQLLLPNFRAVENNNIRLGRESTFKKNVLLLF